MRVMATTGRWRREKYFYFIRGSGGGAARRALAFMLQQQFLAQPNVVRCDFHQFIIVNEFQRLFQAHANRRRELDIFIRASCTNVGQLFPLERVNHQIVVAFMNTDEAAFIDFLAVADEEAATLLQVEEGVTQCLACTIGDEDTVGALSVLARFYGAVVREHTVDQSGTLGAGKKLGAKTDQSA